MSIWLEMPPSSSTAREHPSAPITADISGKRGQVTGTDSTGGGLMTIAGSVPLSEIAGYQARLRSMTGGQGSYTIEFSHYAPVPPQTQQQLASQFKLAKEED